MPRLSVSHPKWCISCCFAPPVSAFVHHRPSKIINKLYAYRPLSFKKKNFLDFPLSFDIIEQS